MNERILYLTLDCRLARYKLISPRISQYNNQGQTTTLETSCPTLYDKLVGSFTSPANHFNAEDAGGGTYGLQSLSEKTWKSNQIRMWLFETLRDGPAGWTWKRDARPPSHLKFYFNLLKIITILYSLELYLSPFVENEMFDNKQKECHTFA